MTSLTNDFSQLPPFGLMDIFNHLIMGKADYDKSKLTSWHSFPEYNLCLNGHIHTLLAEPFLTVHMLCTKKRLCTNPVKFLLRMLSALVSNSSQPMLNRCSFPFAGPFAALFTSGGLSFDHRFLPKIDAWA